MRRYLISFLSAVSLWNLCSVLVRWLRCRSRALQVRCVLFPVGLVATVVMQSCLVWAWLLLSLVMSLLVSSMFGLLGVTCRVLVIVRCVVAVPFWLVLTCFPVVSSRGRDGETPSFLLSTVSVLVRCFVVVSVSVLMLIGCGFLLKTLLIRGLVKVVSFGLVRVWVVVVFGVLLVVVSVLVRLVPNEAVAGLVPNVVWNRLAVLVRCPRCSVTLLSSVGVGVRLGCRPNMGLRAVCVLVRLFAVIRVAVRWQWTGRQLRLSVSVVVNRVWVLVSPLLCNRHMFPRQGKWLLLGVTVTVPLTVVRVVGTMLKCVQKLESRVQVLVRQILIPPLCLALNLWWMLISIRCRPVGRVERLGLGTGWTMFRVDMVGVTKRVLKRVVRVA